MEISPRSGQFRLLVLLAVVVCLALAGFVAWRWQHGADITPDDAQASSSSAEDPRLTFRTPYRNVRPEVKYVGDAACSPCHRNYCDSYHRHPMGRSFAPLAELMAAGKIEFPARASFEALGLQFTVERRGDRLFHRESCRTSQGKVIAEKEAEVRFLLGSGARGGGFSCLVGDDGYLFQSPISWYADKKIWDLSPGYREENAHFDRPITQGCIYCHVNQAQLVEHTDNRYREPLSLGGYAIGCERCHGPGELHVRQREAEAKAAGENEDDQKPVPVLDDTIVNPARLESSLREAVCQQCHLQGHTQILRSGRQFFDYRPGLPLHLFWTTFVWAPQHPQSRKRVGQVEQMYLSKCFRASDGKFGCISCHDPHELPAPETSAAYFRQRCQRCHTEHSPCKESLTVRRRQNEDNCVSCHMPRNKTVIAHLAATDHRILRRPGSSSAAPKLLQPLSPWEPPLVAFHQNLQEPGDPEVGRALGVALMDLAGGPAMGEFLKKQLAEQALPLLEQAPEDAVTWEARGDALQCLGRYTDALSAYETANAKAPWREFGLVQASRIAERLGRPAAALDFSQRALAARPWLWLYHYKVARLQANAQEWSKALTHCDEALRQNPFSGEVRFLQVRCLLASGKKEQARDAFDALLALAPGRADELRRQLGEQLR